MTSDKVQVFIVEDNPNARDDLEQCLSRYPEVEVIGTCTHSKAAIEALRTMRPDLVFLDIELPNENEGFKVLDKIDYNPVVVIYSAFKEKYAFESFEEREAAGFLSKPIQEERFDKILKRSFRLLKDKEEHRCAQLAQQKINLGYMQLSFGGQARWVTRDQILAVQSQKEYNRYFVQGEPLQPEKRESLAQALKQLGSEEFLQVQKSWIINQNLWEGWEPRKRLITIRGLAEPVKAGKGEFLEKVRQAWEAKKFSPHTC